MELNGIASARGPCGCISFFLLHFIRCVASGVLLIRSIRYISLEFNVFMRCFYALFLRRLKGAFLAI